MVHLHTYENNVSITFRNYVRHCDVFFITSQLRYLFDVLMFFMRLELRYILVRSNYVRKLRYKMVIF